MKQLILGILSTLVINSYAGAVSTAEVNNDISDSDISIPEFNSLETGFKTKSNDPGYYNQLAKLDNGDLVSYKCHISVANCPIDPSHTILSATNGMPDAIVKWQKTGNIAPEIINPRLIYGNNGDLVVYDVYGKVKWSMFQKVAQR